MSKRGAWWAYSEKLSGGVSLFDSFYWQVLGICLGPQKALSPYY